jgi:ABC-type multidrug transport system fused ATPase/permease subunit
LNHQGWGSQFHPLVFRLGWRESRPVSINPDAIAIRGARKHKLKNLSLTIPRDQFVVVTGVSGSGKSTLAFDLATGSNINC